MKTFKRIVKFLVPLSFFAIANITDAVNLAVGNAIAGIMTILVLATYAIEYLIESRK